MPIPSLILCLVTDLTRAGGITPLLDSISRAITGGVNLVQVRAHELDEAAFASLASDIAETARGRAMVTVNGPVAAALVARADGIHLPENAPRPDLPAEVSLLTGRSVHSVESARRAEAEGADYIILGTVFPSASHPGGPTGGLSLVSGAARAVSIPVIGIGGITAENAAEVISAGASGIAVISAIIGQYDPEAAARGLARAIGL